MHDLNEISIFCRVIERKSFSAAARDLHLSPSVVSKRVTALEERLGVQLLNRSTRRLSLTEAGMQFYRRSTQALAELEAAAGDAAGDARSFSGTLRVHANLGVGLRAVASGILDFAEKYPDLNIDLSIGAEPVNLLERGVDVVIRSADLRDSSLESRELVPVTYYICATPGYFERAGRPPTPRDLVNFNCLTHSGHRPHLDWAFRGPSGIYTVRVTGTFSTNSGAALHEAALRGLGIARLPGYTAWKPLQSGALECIFEGLHVSDRTIRAFYPRTRHPSARLVAFLDHLEGYMKERHDRAWARAGGTTAQAAS